jgi:uncharacterized membrane protein YphA (DoxX/SURF4 family)
MHLRKVVTVLVHVSRFILAALFLFTAGAKLWILTEFVGKMAELLSSMHFNYERWQWPATIAVIAVEIVVALLLIIPRTIRLGALFAALLLIGFSAFALYYVYVLGGEKLECNCFGKLIGSQLGVKTALRNLVLLVPALIVFFGAPRRSSTDYANYTDKKFDS